MCFCTCQQCMLLVTCQMLITAKNFADWVCRDKLVTYFVVEHLACGSYTFQFNWMNWRSCSRTCIQIDRDCHKDTGIIVQFLIWCRMISWCLRCVQTKQIAVSFTHKCTQNNIKKLTDTHEVCSLHENCTEYLLSYIFTK